MADVLATAFAAFAASAHERVFPAEARRRAVDAITDCVGCQLAGSAEPAAEIMLKTMASASEPSAALPSALVGRNAYAGIAEAALYGGTAAHALDYDDTNHPAYAHPSAVIVPAALAVAPLSQASGRDLVSAYIVGLDMFGKLGRAFNTAHYKRGWHATKSFGCLAAALAAGSILRLDTATMETALAIAASSAGGLRGNFGTMTKPLHAGQAAEAGVRAALLARAGFTAARGVLEHRFGYAAVFGTPGADIAHLARPGEPLEILSEYGLALKPYPACGATHPAIEAATQIHAEMAGREIAEIRVGASALSFDPLIYTDPKTALEAKFSMNFCVAAGLLYGEVLLSTFGSNALTDSRLRALLSRMTVVVDDRVADSPEFAAAVAVSFSDGSSVEKLVPLAKGKPSRWFSEAELEAKFDDCAKVMNDPTLSGKLYRKLRSLDGPVSLTEIAAATAFAAARSTAA
ncbi:MmgE/PrpD family protein [Bosea sp. BK604]|uniref:MmgE/PrpD family protein n=1 Tax=Bosea sp. BK604 TaxID=2512180 RepID=UPI0010E134FE|nr:MmgE/PrpD family protein [Bosea sp. BK604]TCR62548.1 2-methylcitrate dehydratase PrpD [Bosea sp. BK604]